MKDFWHLSTRLSLTLLSSTLCACIVVPKKVSSYDTKCMITTQKIELTVEQVKTFNEIDCLHRSCKAELMGAIATSSFATTASAIVSGSIALAGNTLYWLESKGRCMDLHQHEGDYPNTHPKREKIDEKYLIQEEIITAKS
jgi:hypothetical protein